MLFVFLAVGFTKSPLRILRPLRPSLRFDWPLALGESLKLLPPGGWDPPEAAPVPAVGEARVSGTESFSLFPPTSVCLQLFTFLFCFFL